MSRAGAGDDGGAGAAGGGISCEEALARLYEYLDGELEPADQEEVHRHLEVCRRCYPFFNFERIFLDYVREKGGRAEPPEELRKSVEALLEEES